ARIVLLSPLRQEKMRPPLPDPTEQNKNLRLYRDAIRETATKRGCHFVDLYELVANDSKEPLTDNGLHLTGIGYWRTASSLERGFGLHARPWRVDVDAGGKVQAQGTKAEPVRKAPLCFRVTDFTLPSPPAPEGKNDADRLLPIGGLPLGNYELRIDGKVIVAASAEQWAKGVRLSQVPEFQQVETLRQAIVP